MESEKASSQGGSQKSSLQVATPAVPPGELLPASAAPSGESQTSGSPSTGSGEAAAPPFIIHEAEGDRIVARGHSDIDLVRTCSETIDNGLAPLVAAGVVHPEIAKIVTTNLRTSVLVKCGASVLVWMQLPRTAEAVRIINTPPPDDLEFLERI